MTAVSPPLTAVERAFLTAAVDTLIPADDLSPSGSDCGVVDFIERQLASPWGAGAGLYRAGPFLHGKPEHGYQLPFTPRELLTRGIAAANAWSQQAHRKDFNQLSEADRIAALQAFEDGSAQFGDIPSNEFFEMLLSISMEGFFADPIYGGNRNCVAWKMIGYPGSPARYGEAVATAFGRGYDYRPKSIAGIASELDQEQ